MKRRRYNYTKYQNVDKINESFSSKWTGNKAKREKLNNTNAPIWFVTYCHSMSFHCLNFDSLLSLIERKREGQRELELIESSCIFFFFKYLFYFVCIYGVFKEQTIFQKNRIQER